MMLCTTPWNRRRLRMDLKIYLMSTIFLMFPVFDESGGNVVHTSRQPQNDTGMAITTVLPTPKETERGMESKVTGSEKTSLSPSPPQATSGYNNTKTTNNASFTLTTPVTSSPSITRTTTKRPIVPAPLDPKEDDNFTYNYRRLQVGGLSLAAILCIFGLMVIGCGRVCKIPKCHVGSGKSYQVYQPAKQSE